MRFFNLAISRRVAYMRLYASKYLLMPLTRTILRRIKYLLPRANRLREPYIRPDHAAITYHCIPAKYGSVSINSDPVSNIRMPLASFDRIPAAVLIKRACAYRNALVQLYMGSYARGLTYHHTGTVVYAEVPAD